MSVGNSSIDAHLDGPFSMNLDHDRSATGPRKQARMLSARLDFDWFYAKLVEDAPDAIIYADVGGMIRFWNRVAERIF